MKFMKENLKELFQIFSSDDEITLSFKFINENTLL